MTVDSERPPVDQLAAGWDALVRGAWGDAHAAFAAAVVVDASAEALEGLGMAAWWTNALDESFRAREEAYRRYIERGDKRSAARIAALLSMDHFTRHGAHAVATGWIRRSYRLLDGLEPGPEHALVASWDGHLAILVEHDTSRARRLGAEAAELARSLGIIDLAVLGQALEGFASVCAGEIVAGMQLLDESIAAVVGGELSDPDAMTLTCCYLIYACERTRDIDRARQWCDYLRGLATRWSYQAMFAFCRTHYAGMLIARGDWAEAEAELTAAMIELAGTHPALAAEALIRLAELRRRQGRLDEVADLLHRLEERQYQALGSAHALLGRAALALELGDAPSAESLADRYLRAVRPDNRLERMPGLEVRLRAQLARGDLAGAAGSLHELEGTTSDVAIPSLQAATAFSAGVVAVANGDYEQARQRFESAVDGYRQAGSPDGVARARLELAAALSGLRRNGPAEDEARAALETFQRLGAQREADRAAALLDSLRQQRDRQDVRQAPLKLTPREQEILRLVARGMSDKEIAADLGLSPHTVHRHISNILTRLNVASRAAAVALAARDGLLA